MRYLLLSLILFLPLFSLAQEEVQYEEFSYSEFFRMIEETEDSVFTYENAVVKYNEATDSAFVNRNDQKSGKFLINENAHRISLKPKITLNNVHFLQDTQGIIDFLDNEEDWSFKGVIQHYIFEEQVTLSNTGEFTFNQCTFKKGIVANASGAIKAATDKFNLEGIQISNSVINDELQLFYGFRESDNIENSIMVLDNNRININRKRSENTFKPEIFLFLRASFNSVFIDNEIVGKGRLQFVSDGNQVTDFSNNKIDSIQIQMIINQLKGIDQLSIKGNQFESYVKLTLPELKTNHKVEWAQFEDKLINYQEYIDYWVDQPDTYFLNAQNVQPYYDSIRIANKSVFEGENSVRGVLYNHYSATLNHESKNAVYVEIKDMQTERLAYLYKQDPTFDNFFSLQINRFLKVFSNYGTRPSLAITFSVYVILLFALIYLFFPNHWDSHGKNRIMDRYRFFLKYVNRDSGMHEVYMDEKQPDLLASEDFKLYLQEQGKTAPKFFMVTALPLYRWSVAGTKSASWLLSKVDVLKGKWSETEDSKKGGKSFLLITAFLIALLYDIFIKMLNALMLSINTFTTLGFGEIPIKGLPRYLAIIQGFIGWFMLTIFSVSLISQLLN
ncbi:ion channel [Roseivirga sp.]|uniref:ion channel n=1 Tax=Roseivirga sp. TaxID=1964215 RepID=UPI003B8C7C02